jgi:hypothetical protein
MAICFFLGNLYADPKALSFDKGRIDQALANLLCKAIKDSPKQCEAAIKTGMVCICPVDCYCFMELRDT